MPSKRSSLDSDSLPINYAIERRILETPQLDMSYYFDVVGDVPSLQEHASSVVLEPFDVGNGDVAPEWGFNIVVRGGFLRYGPWADQERSEIASFPGYAFQLMTALALSCKECFFLLRIEIMNQHSISNPGIRDFGPV
jgi:hypothetical protein